MQLKELMKNARLELNKTQQEFADFLNVTQHALSQYENGKRNIPNDLLEKVLSIKEKSEFKKNHSLHAYLEHVFPTWESESTGGWNMIMNKELLLKKQPQKIKVTVSPFGVVIFKKLDESGNALPNEYVNSAEYNEKTQFYYDHMEDSQEMLVSCEDLLVNDHLYSELFEPVDMDEIKKIIQELREI